MCALPLNRPYALLNPISINALEFAKQMLEIHGRIRASHFAGVRDALFLGENDASEVQYELTGEKGRKNRYALRLVLGGQLNLICQRCLGEMSYPVQHTAWFELVTSEANLPEDDDDEIDYLVADAELNVEQLIGQELLLGLPLAPKHGEAGTAQDVLCSNAKEVNKDQKPNPFSVLQGLKRNT
jgi:uncharacterized protein